MMQTSARSYERSDTKPVAWRVFKSSSELDRLAPSWNALAHGGLLSPTADAIWSQCFQRAFEERASGQVEMAFIPEALRLYMPAPPSLTMPLPEPVKPPAYEHPSSGMLAEDLVSLWAVLQADAIVSSPKSWRELVRSQIHRPKDARFAFLEIVALEQGWVRAEDGDNFRVAPESMLAWLPPRSWTKSKS